MKKNKQVILNLITFIVFPVLIGLVNMIKLRVFINNLGPEQNGVYQFYTQFFSYFSLIEAGLELAVYSVLFKFLVNKNYESVNAIVKGARIYWKRIGLICFVIGLALLPIAPLMVRGGVSTKIIVFIQLLYIIKISMSYFFAGPQAVAMADNRGYLIISIDGLGLIVASLITMFIAITTRSLVYVVIFEVLILFLFVIFKFYYVTNKLKWLDLKYKGAPSFSFKSSMKGTSIIKITDMVVNNTDLTVIMIMLGAVASSNFSVYNSFAILIVTILGTSLTSSLQSYLGKKFASNETNKNDKIAQGKLLKDINFLIIIFVVPLISLVLNPFIMIFYGGNQTQGTGFYLLFICFIYFKLLRTPYNTLKVSLGNYNRFSKPAIFNAISNIALSVIFTYFFGLAGVLVGTIVSYLITEFWYEIKVIDMEFLELKLWKIIGTIVIHFSVTMILSYIAYIYLSNKIVGYLSLFGIAGVSFIVYGLVISAILIIRLKIKDLDKGR